jgi:hypothetical protein
MDGQQNIKTHHQITVHRNFLLWFLEKEEQHFRHTSKLIKLLFSITYWMLNLIPVDQFSVTGDCSGVA